ncbi:WecB/TagA/CpsF family glycosyltransferase [Xylanimonas ulmi]|uniref:Exopolysaccharide biosynthesis WecB/TagA/CpsF family protein n=1 Tax=Xylanimonas ulmi TaxID=228973 RepID=A0A4V2EY59_9MICO|nr:WecB/TagA/CpsF family glycosyltransferase [Xylanibacterium ulmi]RZS61850.1 exopolysaccharide biosynthesis WecB/TagA/CpsF family protein [Xylanibacterium ulmi]
MTLSNPVLASAAPPLPRRIRLGGVPVDLHHQDDALSLIRGHTVAEAGRPLGVVSVNLDHLHHFGQGGALNGAFGIREGSRAEVAWLHLIDGAPVAAEARRLTARTWPRLAGSDLIHPLLRNAEADGVSVGFLGGSPQTHRDLPAALAAQHPRLRLAGLWSPSREDLLDDDKSRDLAESIAAAGVDILVVCLGKPRQELWIDRYGAASKARVLLAFGAVADFLAGRVNRCPQWVASHGLEWAWRLAIEPKRLAKRYLVQGPGAYRMLHDERGRDITAPSRVIQAH